MCETDSFFRFVSEKYNFGYYGNIQGFVTVITELVAVCEGGKVNIEWKVFRLESESESLFWATTSEGIEP